MALPGLPGAVAQLINGHRYDFSSIETNVGPLSFTSFTSISYSDTLEPGIQRGQSSKKLGRTRGEYNATGSITMLKQDVPQLLAALAATAAGGYMEAVWDLTATYSASGTDITPAVDVLRGIRLTELSDDHSVGTDALMQELTLDIMEISRNGLSATSGGASLAGIGASIGGIIGGGL